MDIALLDPGLHSNAGHPLDMDLKILGQLKRRGHRVSAYRSPSLSEPGRIPAFFDSLSGNLAQFIDSAKAVAEALQTLEQFDLRRWPSRSASHLPACADVSPATRTSGRTHIRVPAPAAQNEMAGIGFFGHRQRYGNGYRLIPPVVAKLLEQALVKDVIR